MFHFKVLNLNSAKFYQHNLKLAIEYINSTGEKLFHMIIISIHLIQEII